MRHILFLTLLLAVLSCNEKSKPTDDKPTEPKTGSYPEFPGGQIALDEYIRKNLKWIEPKDTIDGFLYVYFTVMTDGSIKDFESKGLGCESCDSAAIRLLKGMPKWIPAKRDGKKIEHRTSILIQFESSTISQYKN